jgi:hypothetical protein
VPIKSAQQPVSAPHPFLPDGTDVPNPGPTARWVNGDFGVGFPLIDRDDPTVYRDLLTRAAAVAQPSQGPGLPRRIAACLDDVARWALP